MSCSHYEHLDVGIFRQLMFDKLCDADADTSPIDSSTVRGIARANASKHFKIGKREQKKKSTKKRKKKNDDDERFDDGSKNAILLHCEQCATLDDGRNQQQLKQIQQRVHLSSVGALCNNNLWICMHCALVCDAKCARIHIQNSEECHLLLQCHDSHVFCATCDSYQYPREIGGDATSNEYLDPIVYEWLIVYGKLRLWWRSLAENDKPKRSSSISFGNMFGRNKKGNKTSKGKGKGKGGEQVAAPMNSRGITNYGNTCFFTSTMQALLAIPDLVQVLENDDSSRDFPVQHALKLFIAEYKKKKSTTIDPRNIWNTVQENALFGNYDENTMEDARALWLDIQDTLNPRLKRKFFSLTTEQCIECSNCGDQGTWTKEEIEPILQVRVIPEHEMTEKESVNADEMKRHEIGMSDLSMNICNMVMDLFAPELLVEPRNVEESYKCEKCNERGGCSKLKRVLCLPKVLIVQINRTYQLEHVRPSFSFKCHRSVICPDRFELSIHQADGTEEKSDSKSNSNSNSNSSSNGNEKMVEYKLCGLNVHDGGIGGGHNMAYRLDPSTKEWSWFSDQHFGPVSADEVARSEASLAFYERIGVDDDDNAFLEEEVDSEEESTILNCKGGCGFFGTADQEGYCTSCAREHGILKK